jgi:hypothetical protein
MRRHHLIITILLLTLAAPAVATAELPTPPSGYQWKSIDEIKASFLIPVSWHFKETKVKETLAYFLTRENIDENGRFETGLSINVLRQGKEFDPVGYAGAFVMKMVEKHEVLEEPFEAGGGKLKGYGCRVRVANEGEPPLIMQYLAIGNTVTGTLYMMFFESPESEWERAWAIAEPILTLFVLDDEI